MVLCFVLLGIFMQIFCTGVDVCFCLSDALTIGGFICFLPAAIWIR